METQSQFAIVFSMSYKFIFCHFQIAIENKSFAISISPFRAPTLTTFKWNLNPFALAFPVNCQSVWRVGFIDIVRKYAMPEMQLLCISISIMSQRMCPQTENAIEIHNCKYNCLEYHFIYLYLDI